MRRKWLLRILITTFIGLVVAVWGAFMRGFTPTTSFPLKLRYASDGCFVSAVILCGIGILTLIASTDFFDIFAYGIETLWSHISSLWKGYEHVQYFDFKTMRAEKRGHGLFYILAIGLVFLFASVILLFLYYAV